MLRFSQVDVFTAELTYGNPVAVVHGADDLSDEQMARVARWTNLSETTFLLRPTDAAADYRLRIFTPGAELPFAGHPTLGSARAWLEAGGAAKSADVVVQECGAGLVAIRRDGPRLAFAAPSLLRCGPVEPADLEPAVRALRIPAESVVDAQWADNGPGWLALLLASADDVLALDPDLPGFGDLRVGVVGPYPPGAECAFEVRVFAPALGVGEDPVTGSLNAGVAPWLMNSGRAGETYTAAQGTVLGRRGRVHVARDGEDVWIGGDTVVGVTGTIAI